MVKIEKVIPLNNKMVRIINNDGKIIKGFLCFDSNKRICLINDISLELNDIDKINEIPKIELDTAKIINKNKKMIENTFDEATTFIRLVDQKEYEENDILSKIPLAVNCTFACELYLKILLLNRGFTVPDIKVLNHNLKKLFINLNDKDIEEINQWIKVFCQYDLLSYLEETKNSLEDLRYYYIEEKVNEVDMNKLLEFTFKIQLYCSLEIKGYDVYRFPNGKPSIEEENNYLDNFVKKNFVVKNDTKISKEND